MLVKSVALTLSPQGQCRIDWLDCFNAPASCHCTPSSCQLWPLKLGGRPCHVARTCSSQAPASCLIICIRPLQCSFPNIFSWQGLSCQVLVPTPKLCFAIISENCYWVWAATERPVTISLIVPQNMACGHQNSMSFIISFSCSMFFAMLCVLCSNLQLCTVNIMIMLSVLSRIKWRKMVCCIFIAIWELLLVSGFRLSIVTIIVFNLLQTAIWLFFKCQIGSILWSSCSNCVSILYT